MLALGDDLDQCGNLIGGLTQCPGCNLTVNDQCRDVRVVGCYLTPSLAAIAACHPDKRQILAAECFNTVDRRAVIRIRHWQSLISIPINSRRYCDPKR